MRATVRVHEGAEGVGTVVALRVADAEQHQVGAVVELDAHPVPADLDFHQVVREELVIHPGLTLDRELLAPDSDGPGGGHAGEREVVGGGPRVAGDLAAHAVAAVHDHGFARLQDEA